MLYIISDMNAMPSRKSIEKKLVSVREKLLALGPLHPGSLSMQFQVCGKPGCRCMDPAHPKPHGPYAKLAYVHRGKQACRFVRAESRPELRKRLRVYKTFRALIDQWIDLSLQLGVLDFFPPPASKKPTR